MGFWRKLKVWLDMLRYTAWSCWMEGLGYSYEKTLQGHDVEKWSNVDWDEWHDAEKAYWERVEAESKSAQQRIRAILPWVKCWLGCAVFNFHSLFSQSWWWAFEKKVLGRDLEARSRARRRRREKRLLLQK